LRTSQLLPHRTCRAHPGLNLVKENFGKVESNAFRARLGCNCRRGLAGWFRHKSAWLRGPGGPSLFSLEESNRDGGQQKRVALRARRCPSARCPLPTPNDTRGQSHGLLVGAKCAATIAESRTPQARGFATDVARRLTSGVRSAARRTLPRLYSARNAGPQSMLPGG
jgi:hypothetical protein